ncbi:MAG TPA: hypothetical protein VF177_04110, partial [Anaerolineae bacterium]
PDFDLHSAADVANLARICRLVAGMPLAIELAAAWVDTLSLADIAAEIQHSFDFLEAERRDVPERHRSVRAAMDTSWEKLAEREQATFAQLSVFRGGFTREAVQAVTGASLPLLSRLVNKSFLRYDRENDRYQIHELLRQFAAEKLAQAPDEEAAARDRHSAYYCAFLHQREELLKGPRSEKATAEIAVDFENVRTAWHWAVDNIETLVYQAQTALGIFCEREGRGQEGEAAFLFAHARLAKRETVDARRMAELLAWGSNFVGWHSREVADELIGRATAYLTKAAAGGEDTRAERALISLIRSRPYQSPEVRVKLLEESLALYQELDRQWEMAWVHQDLAMIYARQARYRLAHEQLRQALQLHEMVGDRRWAIWTKMHIARNMARMGQLAEAEKRLREALVLCKASSDELGAAGGQLRLGQVLLVSGHFEEALARLAKSRAMYANRGMNWGTAHIYHCWAIVHQGRYDEVFHELQLVLRDDQVSDYRRGLARFVQGSAALALARFDEARRHLQESVRVFDTINRPNELSWAEAGLGYVALYIGESAVAQKHLAEALRLCLFEPGLLALPAVALLLAKAGQAERAVELYALAAYHPLVANSRWFYDVAGRELDDLAASLPPEVAEAARERGRALDLWQTAAALLAELEAMSAPE